MTPDQAILGWGTHPHWRVHTSELYSWVKERGDRWILKPGGDSDTVETAPRGHREDDTELRIPWTKGSHGVLKTRSNVETKERGDQEGTQLKGGPKPAHSAGGGGPMS